MYCKKKVHSIFRTLYSASSTSKRLVTTIHVQKAQSFYYYLLFEIIKSSIYDFQDKPIHIRFKELYMWTHFILHCTNMCIRIQSCRVQTLYKLFLQKNIHFWLHIRSSECISRDRHSSHSVHIHKSDMNGIVLYMNDQFAIE